MPVAAFVRPTAHDMSEVQRLDALVHDARGLLRAVPSAVYEEFSTDQIRLWCHFRGVYCIPTLELVDWLRGFIGERSAIEVGAGTGGVGRALGIRTTDSWIQAEPSANLFYRLAGQPTIAYPSDVERIDANAAVERYRPAVVFGCWVTHWIDPELPPPPEGGCIHGLHEDRIADHPAVQAYVMVGHTRVHAHKPLLRRPHLVVHEPGLRSRATDAGENAIFIWSKR